MSRRNINRIEIVESSAGQPWSVRIFRNRQTFRSSESYTRKVDAQRAVLGLAKTFGWEEPAIQVQADGTTVLVDAMPGVSRIPVHYVREMDQVAPQ